MSGAGNRFAVLENHTAAQVRQLARQVAAQDGSTVVLGWQAPTSTEPSPPGVLCVGRVTGAEDAAAAVLAAVGGASLVIDAAAAERDVIDRLCDDLRHLGPLDHRLEPPPQDPLDDVQRQLLGLLMGGATLGQAARALHLSRRTADRRLATARQALGTGSTPEAVTAAHRLGVEPIQCGS